MKKGILLLFVTVFFIAVKASATAIYVSPNGKDSNPGTAQKPFATLNAAIKYARILRKSQKNAGPIEILLKGGTYNITQPLTFTPEDSGTKQAPLIIKGMAGSVPVISGGLTLKKFEKVSNKLWKINIPEISQFSGTIQQLYVNGKRAVRARTPNEDAYFKTRAVTETLIDTSSRSTTKLAVQKVKLTAEQIKALQAAGPDLSGVVISLTHAWDRTRRYINGLSVVDSALIISGDPMQGFNRFTNTSQFVFENSKAFLDAAGEWFMEPNGTLYYIPRAGEKIENSTAIIPITDRLVVLQGNEKQKVENIHFDNLSFQYTRYIMPPAGNETAQAGAPTDATIMADYAENITFNKCEIAHTGCNGIWFRAACRDGKITNSYLHDLGVGGIKIGAIEIPADKEKVTRNIIVDNNIIRSGGYEFPTGVGVLIFQASDNTISHNEIADFRYSGISVGWVWGYSYSPTKRNTIVYNHIHHLGWGLLSDMGGVYTLGKSEGTTVSNNVIHDIYSYGYGGWGLYTDEGSTGVTMENNLVYNCKSSAFHQHYGENNIMNNNIFYSQIRAQLEATRVENHHSFNFTHNIIYYDRGKLIGKAEWGKIKILADSNLYYDPRTKSAQFMSSSLKEWQRSTGNDMHSIVADPQFADPTHGNFTIKNRKAIAEINFKPFDYTKAGVYGDAAWKKLAQLDPAITASYDKMLEQRLSEGEPK